MARRTFPPYTRGDRATFVWRGRRPPRLVGDFNDWEESRAIELQADGAGQWSLTLQLPPDAYVEYAFLLDGQRLPDPANPRRIQNGLEAENSFFYMPEGAPTPLAKRGRVRRGQVTRHSLLGRSYLEAERAQDLFQRTVYLYQPAPSLARGPFPLLVVFDGVDYLYRARLATLLDNLIHQQRITPIACALVSNGGPLRTLEYACNDATLSFLRQDVLPLAQAQLPLVDIQQHPGSYALLGASLGGLMAVYAGLRLPHLFGRVLSQSGGFEPDLALAHLVQWMPVQPVKIWMDVGVLDFLYPDVQPMRQLLLERGYDVIYKEYSGGHNFTAWRDDLPYGLEAMFRPGEDDIPGTI